MRPAVYQSMTDSVGMRESQLFQLDGERIQRRRMRRDFASGLFDFLVGAVSLKARDLPIIELGRTLRKQNLFSVTYSVKCKFERRGAAVQE